MCRPPSIRDRRSGVMPNPYLTRLREQHDKLRTAIEAVQTKAVETERDLTEDELRSITEDATKLKGITEQIEKLADAETQSRAATEQANRLDTLTRETGT